jgi:hypothetical protein
MAVWNEASGVVLDLGDLTPAQLDKLIKTFPQEKVDEINGKLDAFIKANNTMDNVVRLALFVAKAVITKGGSLI